MPDVQFPIKIPAGSAPFPDLGNSTSTAIFELLVQEKIVIIALFGGISPTKGNDMAECLSRHYAEIFPGCTPESKTKMQAIAKTQPGFEATWASTYFKLVKTIYHASEKHEAVKAVISKLTKEEINLDQAQEFREHFPRLEGYRANKKAERAKQNVQEAGTR